MTHSPGPPRLRLALLAAIAFAFAGACGVATYGYLDGQLTASTTR